MSAAQQAEARRRQMRNGYTHLGNARGRPVYKAAAQRNVAESIAAERARSARERARATVKPKGK